MDELNQPGPINQAGGPPPQQQQPHGQFDSWNNPPMMDDPGYNGSDRTYMWQQSNYMTGGMPESGFNSGNTTQQTSISGHDEDPEGLISEGASLVGSSIYTLDSITPIVQSETNSVASAEAVADPTKISQIIQNLNDKDEVVQDATLGCLKKFATNETFLQAIMRSHELIRSLVECMNNSREAMERANPEANPEEYKKVVSRVQHALNIIFKMSKHNREGIPSIVQSDAISCLIKFLKCPVDTITFSSITTLHNVLRLEDEKKFSQDVRCITEQAKGAIRSANGVEALSWLLSRPHLAENVKLHTIIIDCLKILAVKHSQTKEIMLRHEIPQWMVNTLKTRLQHKNLIRFAMRLLKVLAVCPKNKLVIIKSQGIQAITTVLEQVPSSTVRSECVCTLRNLSDAAVKENLGDLSKLFNVLVRLLNEEIQMVQQCQAPLSDISVFTACILCNLTSNNPSNKMALCQAGGINVLVNAISSPSNSNDLVENAISTLTRLTHDHEGAERAQSVLLNETNAIPVLLECMQRNMQPQPPQWSIIKAILGLLKNLSQRSQNQEVLRHQVASWRNGTVEAIKELFLFVTDSQFLKASMPPQDAVRNILELLLACLICMAKHNTNHFIMRDPNFITMLRHLLCWSFQAAKVPTEMLVKRTVRIICYLCNDKDCVRMMSAGGMSDPFKALASSGDKDLAELAHFVMRSISEVPKDENLPQQQQQMSAMQNLGDAFANNQGQFSQRPPLMQQQQQQQQQQPQQSQQRRFPGQSPMQGMPQPGYDGTMPMGGNQGQRFGGPPMAPMDSMNEFPPDMQDLMSPDFAGMGGGPPSFFDEAMS